MTKVCKGALCEGAEKPIDQFGKDKRMKDGLASWCKTCVKEYKKSWRQANLSRVAEKEREWVINNPEKVRAKQKRHYDLNREKRASQSRKYQSANQEKVAQRHSQWRKDNPDKVREYSANRRATTKERTRVQPISGFWTALLWFYGNPRCMNPDCKTPERMASLDHVVALENGGWHEFSNWQVLCTSCNSSKQHLRTVDYRDWTKGILVDTTGGRRDFDRSGEIRVIEDLSELFS